jgi:hypothetical protein
MRFSKREPNAKKRRQELTLETKMGPPAFQDFFRLL